MSTVMKYKYKSHVQGKANNSYELEPGNLMQEGTEKQVQAEWWWGLNTGGRSF